MSLALQWILQQDRSLFVWLNTRLIGTFGDHFFVWITNKNHWIIPLVILWIVLIWRGGKKGRWLAVALVIGLGLSDFISSHLLKPWVGRLRPCWSLDNIRVLVNCAGRFSFPSSHATNATTIATLFAFFYPRGKWLYFLLAFLVGYSRIYVGVHYPLDVLGGFLLGISIGWLVYLLVQKLQSGTQFLLDRLSKRY